MHFTGTKSSSSHTLSKDDNMFMPDYMKTHKQSCTYTVRQAARYVNSQPSSGPNTYHLLSIGISQNMVRRPNNSGTLQYTYSWQLSVHLNSLGLVRSDDLP